MIQSFDQIRLSNQLMNAMGGQLVVAGQNVVYSGLLASSCNFLQNEITSLSGMLTSTLQNEILLSSSNFLGNNAGALANNSAFSNCIGNNAGTLANNSAFSNFIGNNAGTLTNNSFFSNFMGYNAGSLANNSAFSNFMGYNAGANATNANSSIFIGNNAGGAAIGNNTTGLNNVIAIGCNSAYQDNVCNASGYSSILIGDYTQTSGFSNSITIGRGTANSNSGQFNIGNLLFGNGIYTGTGNSNQAQIGQVGIGTNNPAATLDVNGSGNFSSGLYISGVNITSYFGTSTVSDATGIFLQGEITSLSGHVITLVSLVAANLAITIGESTQLQINNLSGSLSGLLNDSGVFLQNEITSLSGTLTDSLGIVTYDDQVVHTSGNEIISGIKLFTGFIIAREIVADSGQIGIFNISIGTSAGSTTSGPIGTYNIYFGNYAGFDNTGAGNNVGIGYGVLGNSSTYLSVAIGSDAGDKTTDSTRCNFIGNGAGSQTYTTDSSNFIGCNAGANASNVNSSNFIGDTAGSSATNANSSNFMGYDAGSLAQNSAFSNFIGYTAGAQTHNLSACNFIGYGAGLQTYNSDSSNFIGNNAGAFSSNANSSNFIGHNAGGAAYGYNTTGLNNVIAIGYNSAYQDTANNASGYSSILIGDYTQTSGFSNSITIGRGTANSNSGQFNIGNLLFGNGIYTGTDTSNQAQIGQVGIGTNNPAATLDVNGSGNFSSGLYISGVNITSYFGTSTVSDATGIFLQNEITSLSGTLISLSLGTTTILTGAISTYSTLNSSSRLINCDFNLPKSFVTLTDGMGPFVWTFTGVNVPAGNNYAATSLFVNNNVTSTTGSLVFPSGWIWLGLMPIYLAAGKSAYLNLESFGENIVAAWGTQY